MASRAYNFLKRGCGDRTLDSAGVTAVNALTVGTSLKLNDILDIVREVEIRGRAVGTSSIGQASSVNN